MVGTSNRDRPFNTSMVRFDQYSGALVISVLNCKPILGIHNLVNFRNKNLLGA